MTSLVTGMTGIVAGVPLSIASGLVGGFIAKVTSQARNVNAETTQLNISLGDVVGTCGLIAALDPTPFTTGIKVTTIVASIISSALNGVLTSATSVKNREVKISDLVSSDESTAKSTLLGIVASTIAGIVVSILGAAALNSLAACCLGSVTAWALGNAAYTAIQQNQDPLTKLKSYIGF